MTTSSKEESCTSPEVSSFGVQKEMRRIDLHVKALYVYCALLTVAFIGLAWFCVSSIHHLRRDMDDVIDTRFSEHYVDFIVGEDAVPMSKLDSEGGEIAKRVLRELNGDSNSGDSASSDNNGRRVRVRRRVARTGKTEQKGPTFMWGGGKGEYDGSSGSDENWVWLTSYSRIPVSFPLTCISHINFLKFIDKYTNAITHEFANKHAYYNTSACLVIFTCKFMFV